MPSASAPPASPGLHRDDSRDQRNDDRDREPRSPRPCRGDAVEEVQEEEPDADRRDSRETVETPPRPTGTPRTRTRATASSGASAGTRRPAARLRPRRRARRRHPRPRAAAVRRASRLGAVRAAHAPTPAASAIAIAASPAARREPATASITCHRIGSVVLNCIAMDGHMTAMLPAAAPSAIARTIASARASQWLAQPAPHAEDQRREPREREQQCCRDLCGLQAARALALRAKPRLRHVDEAAGADDLVAGERHADPRLTALADVDPRVREDERPVGARRPILLLRRDERQRGRIRCRTVRAHAVPRASARPPSAIVLPAAASGSTCRICRTLPSGSIVMRHSSARAATSPSNVA